MHSDVAADHAVMRKSGGAANLPRPPFCLVVEVELFMSIGWSWLIREVGRFSRNRVVLVLDTKDG